MEAFEGIELTKIFENAKTATRKEAEQAIVGQMRGALTDEINLKSKVARLKIDTAKAEALLAEATSRRERLQSGDWTAIDPFELKEQKTDQKQPQVKSE